MSTDVNRVRVSSRSCCSHFLHSCIPCFVGWVFSHNNGEVVCIQRRKGRIVIKIKFWVDILACHRKESTGVNSEMNDGWVPFSCFPLRLLVLMSWMLWVTPVPFLLFPLWLSYENGQSTRLLCIFLMKLSKLDVNNMWRKVPVLMNAYDSLNMFLCLAISHTDMTDSNRKSQAV